MTPDAFQAAILANPHDNAPRLVYADWLEERGECHRAEFIRVQLARHHGETLTADQSDALRKREAELKSLIGLPDKLQIPHAVKRRRPHSFEAHYARGFVEYVVGKWEAWFACAEQLRAECPLLRVQLLDWPPLFWGWHLGGGGAIEEILYGLEGCTETKRDPGGLIEVTPPEHRPALRRSCITDVLQLQYPGLSFTLPHDSVARGRTNSDWGIEEETGPVDDWEQTASAVS